MEYYEIQAVSGKKVKRYETNGNEISLIGSQIINDYTRAQLKKIKINATKISADLFMYYRRSKIEKLLVAA